MSEDRRAHSGAAVMFKGWVLEREEVWKWFGIRDSQT
jgi:hypothetical protein